VLESLNLGLAAKEISEMMETLRASAGSPIAHALKEPLVTNLPAAESIVTEFIGRERELDQVRAWFDNPERRRWALCGEGGAGKTSLAYRFAQEIVDRAPAFLRCVFWLSAKKRKFMEGGTVDIHLPDFHNLDSALNLLALEYGKERVLNLSSQRKRAAVLRMLKDLPTLLVVDDIDSIEDVDADVVEFFTNDVTSSRSKTKILFTSRREMFGMAAFRTEIRGLDDVDAPRFITSRSARFGIDESLLKPDVIKGIVAATGGSPLYMEDLLRLAQYVGPKEAIKVWEQERGDAARAFSLKREFDLLSEDARNVLIAACIQPMAISGIEARTVLRLNDERFELAIEKLRGLFLMQKPAMVRRELRYEVNVNLRRLVTRIMSESDQFQRVKNAYAAHAGELTSGRGEEKSIVRQASLLVRGGQAVEAEELLVKTMEAQGRKPVLLTELGWVYASANPPRTAEARTLFQESVGLRKSSDETFVKWCRMELAIKEYTRACSVAEKGLDLHPRSFELTRLAGVAFGEVARENQKYSKPQSAETAFERSTFYYWKALDLPHPAHVNDREVDASLFRGLLYNYRFTGGLEEIVPVFSEWSQRQPVDPTMDLELYRVMQRYSDDPDKQCEADRLLRGFR
jgi:hypothetical protein